MRPSGCAAFAALHCVFSQMEDFGVDTALEDAIKNAKLVKVSNRRCSREMDSLNLIFVLCNSGTQEEAPGTGR